MKSHNKFLASAIAVAIGTLASSAFAGNMSSTTKYLATEVFGPTQAATVALTPTAVSYAISSPGGVTLAVGQSMNVYFRLSGTHVFAAAPAVGAFNTVGGLAPASTAIGTGAFANTIVVTYTNGGVAAVNLPLGTAIIWTPATAITVKSAEMSTAGGTVQVTGSIDGNVVNTQAATLPSSQDPVAAAVTLAVSTQAITGAVQKSSDFVAAAAPLVRVEGAKINLGATPPGTNFAVSGSATTNTASNIINFGSVTFSDNASVVPTVLAGTAYTLATAVPATGLEVTLTPDAGKTFPVGSTVNLYSDAACTTAVGTASAALDATTAATAVKVVSTAAPATKTPVYVCLTLKAAPITAVNAATPVTPTISAVLKKTVATDASNSIAAAAGYALGYNGSLVDVTNYVPAGVTGWTQFLRVVNTGGQTAAVSAAVIDEVTGVAGTAVQVIPSLAAGAVKNLTAAELEAAVGAVDATKRPRIRFTAPTTGMNVQNMLFTPNGSFTNNSSKE